jgi:hypothetical protein
LRLQVLPGLYLLLQQFKMGIRMVRCHFFCFLHTARCQPGMHRCQGNSEKRIATWYTLRTLLLQIGHCPHTQPYSTNMQPPLTADRLACLAIAASEITADCWDLTQ